MSRFLSGIFLLLAILPAFAQGKPEAPAEKADPLVVLLFLVLLIGSGLAYAGYLWWQHRKHPPEKDR
jgi:hypothetical protein